jgi:tartrate-resistant acid phosphatase type 5
MTTIATNLSCLDNHNVQDGYRGGHIEGIKKFDKSLNFIAFGDWGRNGEYYQKEVAQQMGAAAKDIEAAFFIVAGDNFYPNGVASIYDDHWASSFNDIYTANSLHNDWWVVLGNHDYRGNVDAQMGYAHISRRWRMPARYYAQTMSIAGDTTQQVLLLALDTCPFIQCYYEDEVYKDGVTGQDTAAQIEWLEQQLQNIADTVKWVVVVGHHPAYTGGKRFETEETLDIRNQFKPIFDKYGVDFFISGHEHSLQYIKPEGQTHYLVTGAGSEATATILYPETGRFAAETGGFMAFSLTPDKALLQIIDYKGVIMYTHVIEKSEKAVYTEGVSLQ